MWMIVYAYTSNKNIDAGRVPLQDMGSKILFENFIAINLDGKVYREYKNISDKPVGPNVRTLLIKTTIRLNTIDRGKIIKKAPVEISRLDHPVGPIRANQR
jgi:hypothetical protein